MIIDAHQHYWDPRRHRYGWLEPGSPLDRCWLTADLEPARRACGVAGTILVQAAPSEHETDWLLDLAAGDASIRGVVGWLDLNAKDFAARFADRRSRGLVGVRPMLQDLADPDWILSPGRAGSLAALAEAGLAFDALVRPDGLPAIIALADRLPGLSIVLDHAGKPPFGEAHEYEQWMCLLRELAQRANVTCKLSGLLTEAPAEGADAAVFDAIGRLAEIWGPDRLIWGSDWPVLTLVSDYVSWLALARNALGGLDEQERSMVFAGNAARVYRL